MARVKNEIKDVSLNTSRIAKFLYGMWEESDGVTRGSSSPY